MTRKCLSCKNKTSNDQCRNNSLVGIVFCGIHSKIKNPRLWVNINNVELKVLLISKMWKGYSVRKCLRLAGSGVLKRSICNNTDEIMSFEPIAKVSPSDYFGFEEKNKTYGFHICSILDIVNRSTIPQNPYTREPLDMQTRMRLRELYGYRIRNSLPTYHEDSKLVGCENILANRWLQLSQIIEENGFYNLNSNVFLGLNKSQLYIFLNMIFNDMKTWAAEHKNKSSKRFLYSYWIRNILNKHSSSRSLQEYSFYVSTILLTILYNSTEPYNISFIIMSSLYRL
jgi:hypothetical protein